MSPIMKQYLKVFLFTGITYGLVMYILDHFYWEDQNGILTYISLGCVFGVLMSASLVTYQRYRLRKEGEDVSEENLKVTQTKTIESKLDIDSVISRLKNDSATKNMKIVKTASGLKLKTGMTLRSWGENITIKTNNVNGHSGYEIESASKMKSTLIDYGKNLKNVKEIIRILS